MNKTKIIDEALIKRNNEAPSFLPSLVRNRTQLFIERYIQVENYDLQDYIESQRILKLDISVRQLREWYPTPNWKKEINKMCSDLMRIKGAQDSKGNFDYMTLFSRAKLDDTGLHLNVDPEVLKIYIITQGTPYTSLDYNLTNLFKFSYTYEIHWQMCLHDRPSSSYRFFLSPREINDKFQNEYNVTNIVKKILEPSRKEIKALYDEGLSQRFFTYEERREIVGKCKKIIGWEFIIHNVARTTREDEEAQEAFKKIDIILRDYMPKYRVNILYQVKLLKSEKIIQLLMRLEKFVQSDKTGINNSTAYLYYIIQRYDINPRSKKVDRSKIQSSPLFAKEEKDTEAGLEYWSRCIQHIIESDVSADFKDLFSKLKFYKYSEDKDIPKMEFRTDRDTYITIEQYFLEEFKEVLMRYFPTNIEVYYKVDE